MGSVPWRNAASLMLFQRCRPTNGFDYQLLMLKRSSKSKFMPNARVFPGGVCDPQDFVEQWKPIVERGKPSAARNLDLGPADRPMLIKSEILPFDSTPSEKPSRNPVS